MSARPEVTLKTNSHEIKTQRYSAFTEASLISIRQLITDIFQFKYIDDVILRQPEVRMSTAAFEILK